MCVCVFVCACVCARVFWSSIQCSGVPVFWNSALVPEFSPCSSVLEFSPVLSGPMAAPDSVEENRKRAAVRIATMLRSYMGVDHEGNLKQDMYSVFQEKLARPEAKDDFRIKIEALKAKLQGLGISSDTVADPIRV